jgi:hypothetical protein
LEVTKILEVNKKYWKLTKILEVNKNIGSYKNIGS